MLGDSNPHWGVHNGGMHTRLITVLVVFLATSLASAVVASQGVGLESGLLVAIGLVLLTTLAAIGLTVSHARWAARTLMVTTGAGVAVVALADQGLAWYVALTGIAFSVAAIASGTLEPLIRQLPPPAPLPAAPLLLMIGLLGVPLVTGFWGGASLPHVTFAGVSVLFAWRLGQGGPVGLWLGRLVLPIMGLWAILSSPSPDRFALLTYTVVLIWFAWSKETRLAAVPLVTHAQLKPVFAELAPADILAAAGYDEHGKRVEQP